MDLNQFSTVDIVLDKANDNFIQKQTISAGDRDGRSLTLQVTDAGSIGEVPGLTANLLWTNHSSGVSDLSAFSVVDRTTSVFKIDYPQNMLTAGKVTAQIQLLHNGKVTHSKKFEIIVLDIAGKLKGVLQTAEYTALVEALAKTNGFEADIANLEINKAEKTSLIATDLIVKNLSDRKADISLVNDLLANVSQGGPADTLNSYSELVAKYPSGSNKPMLVKEADGITGYVYTWTSGAWKKGVLYQNTGLPEATKKIIETALHGDTIVQNTQEPAPEYKDLNNLKPNTVVNYAISGGKVLNVPPGFADTGSFTVVTMSPKNAINQQSIQILIDKYNRFFHRICWGGNWTAWAMPDKWSVHNKILTPGTLVAPYDNLNTLPVPSTVTYGRGDVLNAPNGVVDYVITTMSGSGNLSGAMQLLVDKNTRHTYVRVGWGPVSNISFTSWNQLDKEPETPTPSEERYDSPSLSMFGNFGVVGDSFASGSLKVGEEWGGQTDNTTWGVMMARKWGTTMLHLASSGLSTRSWLNHSNGLPKLNSSDAQDIYYCVLGINDYWSLGLDYIGYVEDIESGADTFYGNYGKIIKAIQAKAPKAKILLFGIADPSEVATAFNVAIKAIASNFGVPYVDQRADKLFTSNYYLNNMVGGHPTGPMYASMALAFDRLIKKAVVDNFAYFKDYGL